MNIIRHRINTRDQLNQLSTSPRSIEIDLRYHHNNLILEHDPYNHQKQSLTYFDQFMEEFVKDAGFLIVNIKSEGIEDKCLKIMEKYRFTNFAFLDSSLAFIIKKVRTQSLLPKNIMLRISEHESLESVLSFKDKAMWVWIDFFDHFNFDQKTSNVLKQHDFKICVVSPELQGHPFSQIMKVKQHILSLSPDAVCTKDPDSWLNK